MAHPEGFKFFYNRFVTNFNPERDVLVKASTYQNKHLPEGYIEQLKSQFSPELIEAYLNGTFVNMTSGVVYKQYDREKHDSKEREDGKEPLYIGMDFNVTKMSASVGVWIENDIHIVDEITKAFDTPEMIEIIVNRYGNSFKREIHVYPDASGGARKTINASTTDLKLLRDAGFKVHAPNKNPSVRDRITTTNTNFLSARGTTRVYINATQCPEHAKCLEQLTYNNNGEVDKTADNDHIPDAFSYLIMGVLPIKLFRRKKDDFKPESRYQMIDKSSTDGLSA